MYADCVTLLARHFIAPQSVMVRWIILCQRQHPGEWVHRYVTDLWCLASLGKFGPLEEEMIHDQLAEHTTDPKLWERLFMLPDDLLLSRCWKWPSSSSLLLC